MESEAKKEEIKSWWQGYPFTYFVKDEPGSWNFFRNIDRKVLKWMPWAQKGFPLLSNLIDYSSLRGKRVLDIGCGTGWTTAEFALAGAEVHAIDLTEKAIELAKKHLELYGLTGEIKIGDAENLNFPDSYFDYVLAWGVLMHTPNTGKAISEIRRVLKPGGRACAMMYNKNSLHWRWFLWFGKGILKLKLLTMSSQKLANRYTDGAERGGNALTKFYTPRELRKMWSRFSDVEIKTFDHPDVLKVFPHRFLPVGALLPLKIRQKLASRFGLSAWIEAVK